MNTRYCRKEPNGFYEILIFDTHDGLIKFCKNNIYRVAAYIDLFQ